MLCLGCRCFVIFPQDLWYMRQNKLTQLTVLNIKRKRLERAWSQEELAERCGLHRTYIGSIERGERNITLATLERIALALEVTPQQLISEVKNGN